MKKLFALVLVCLLLTACGAGDVEPAETTENPNGLYLPDSTVELQTGGAVRAYPLKSGGTKVLAPMGGKLLLLQEDGMLTALAGDLCQTAAMLQTEKNLTAAEAEYDICETGIAYYCENRRQVVRLNQWLQQTATYDLPENIQGRPAISLKKQEIYYFSDKTLRALSMQTGISRLLRTFTDEASALTGVYFDGAVLSCSINGQTQYISSQTGQTLRTDQALMELHTHADRYLATRMDGQVLQQIFGTLSTEAKSLYAEEGKLVTALPLNGAVRYTAEETGLSLRFYDLTSGKQTAAVMLEGVPDPVAWCADSQYIWFVAGNKENQVLYRWDMSQSPAEDEAVYTGALYTAQSPDRGGLARCQKRVDELNNTYGVRIRIWQDAVLQTGEYTMIPEHQVAAIERFLDELETLLPQFPAKFLQKTVEAGWVRVCFVRSIEGGESNVQYWAEGDCYIAISQAGDVKTAFLQGLAYGIDSHVLGNSRDFDTWNALNPQGFAYGLTDYSYLEGESRAFVDADSMRNPHEDRSRMIACAMAEGNQSLFESQIMQNKLLRICQGIREAYGLEKSKDSFFWEQYLNQSLAYTK